MILYSESIPTEGLLAVKKQIDQNYYTFDYKKLAGILNECDKIEAKYSSWQILYYRGMLHLMMGKIIYNDDGDKAYDHFDSSVSDLDEAYKKHKDPEIAALLSSAYGKKSSLSGINAFFLGIKAKNWIYDAHAADTSNPKIFLVAATHLMHLPGFYGGDKDKAEKYLYKALELNKNPEKDKWMLEWAQNAEIYAYLAQLEILKENIKKAESYMEKALAAAPDYGFVKIDLRNQLNKLKNDN